MLEDEDYELAITGWVNWSQYMKKRFLICKFCNYTDPISPS